jgi:hypothetical protein
MQYTGKRRELPGDLRTGFGPSALIGYDFVPKAVRQGWDRRNMAFIVTPSPLPLHR